MRDVRERLKNKPNLHNTRKLYVSINNRQPIRQLEGDCTCGVRYKEEHIKITVIRNTHQQKQTTNGGEA